MTAHASSKTNDPRMWLADIQFKISLVALIAVVSMALLTIAFATADFMAPWRHTDFSAGPDVSAAMPSEFGKVRLSGPTARNSPSDRRPVVLTSIGGDGALLRVEMSLQAAYVLVEHARKKP